MKKLIMLKAPDHYSGRNTQLRCKFQYAFF